MIFKGQTEFSKNVKKSAVKLEQNVRYVFHFFTVVSNGNHL